MVRLDDETEFVVADIPGLIEGASEGKGLGHQFLRHVERARVLCLMVDLAPMDGVWPNEQERILLDELGDYQPDLLERPRIVVGTKADMVQDGDLEVMEWDGDVVSAITGDGLSALVGKMAVTRPRCPPAGATRRRPDRDPARAERCDRRTRRRG